MCASILQGRICASTSGNPPPSPRLLRSFLSFPFSRCVHAGDKFSRPFRPFTTGPVALHGEQRPGVQRPARGLAHGSVVRLPSHRPGLYLSCPWFWLRGPRERHLLRASSGKHRRHSRECAPWVGLLTPHLDRGRSVADQGRCIPTKTAHSEKTGRNLARPGQVSVGRWTPPTR